MATTGRRKSTLAALVATLAVSLVPVLSVGPATASVSRIPLTAGRTLSGVVGGGGESTADAFAAYRGRANEVVTSYTSTDSWDLITGVTKQGLTQIYSGTNAHMVWSVPLLPLNGTASLSQAAAGAYNAKYASVAQQLVAGGDGSATIRLGWELNGDWYTWGGVKDPTSFVGAWRQAVTAMRGVAGAHFTFDWNITLGYANPVPLYPGDAYVDIIGADVYDASYSTSFAATNHTAAWNYYLTRSWGLNWLASYAAQHGKRISLPEWGVQWLCDGHGGGDDPYFIQQMYAWIDAHDVAYEAYYNHDPDSCNNSALNDGRFPQSSAAYKKLFAVATTPPGSTPPVTTPAPAPAAALDLTRIKVSTSAARTNPVMLFASTVTGSAYVFLADATGTAQVKFFLDKASTATPTSTDSAVPWDLEGGTTAAANPLATGSLSKGSHQLTVVVTLTNKLVQSATVSFTVK